jgi:hypothetical protein
MKKQNIRKLLDYLPLTCLIISAFSLLLARLNGQILLQVRHIVGLAALLLPLTLFFVRHKLGVLATGLVILIGLFGGLSYSPAITTTTIGKTWGDSQITLLYFQPIFIIWAILHFIVSGRYYTGVASKRYWNNLSSDKPLKI